MTSPVFPGRVEAKCTIPTGGAAVSATIANGAGATSATAAAGSYYLTAAGGVSSLLSTFKDALDNNVQGYPQTATATANAIGYGVWTTGAGYLCNETSGSLAAVYGAPSLTAISTPTYGTLGPRSGIDKAVGLDSSGDGFNGGNVFDVGATDDLIIAWVGKFTSVPANFTTVVSKGTGAAGNGWILFVNGGNLVFQGSTNSAGVVAVPTNWHVGIACIDRGAGKLRVGVADLVTGIVTVGATGNTEVSYTSASNFVIGGGGAWLANAASPFLLSAFYVVKGNVVAANLSTNLSTALTNFYTAINSVWSVALSTTTGLVSIGWTGYATPTWSLAWTNTTLRDVLGFTADISAVSTTQTGTKQARGLWLPDCPLNLEGGDPDQAPKVTDLRSTMSPTGAVLSLTGNAMYRHRGITWSHVPKERTWESAVQYANASWEYFANECILGLGSTWFVPSSELQIYYNSAGTQKALGNTYNSNAGVSGWQTLNLSSIEPKRSEGDWTGLFRVELGDVVSDG